MINNQVLSDSTYREMVKALIRENYNLPINSEDFQDWAIMDQTEMKDNWDKISQIIEELNAEELESAKRKFEEEEQKEKENIRILITQINNLTEESTENVFPEWYYRKYLNWEISYKATMYVYSQSYKNIYGKYDSVKVESFADILQTFYRFYPELESRDFELKLKIAIRNYFMNMVSPLDGIIGKVYYEIV